MDGKDPNLMKPLWVAILTSLMCCSCGDRNSERAESQEPPQVAALTPERLTVVVSMLVEKVSLADHSLEFWGIRDLISVDDDADWILQVTVTNGTTAYPQGSRLAFAIRSPESLFGCAEQEITGYDSVIEFVREAEASGRNAPALRVIELRNRRDDVPGDLDGVIGSFHASRPYRVFNRTYTLHYRPTCKVNLPTGHIVACDWLDTDPFTRTVPPGRYDVILAEHDALVAYAILRFRDGIPARWEMATQPGEDVRSLPEGYYYMYPVDGGNGSFMDEKTNRELRLIVDADPEAYFEAKTARMKMRAWKWCNYAVGPLAELNSVWFSSGMGDGGYASYFGLADNGEVLCLLTDFDALDCKHTPEVQFEGMPRRSLLRAARKGDSEGVRRLCRQGVFSDVLGPMGRTPLMYSVAGGHVDIVRTLLESGASVHRADRMGITALYRAAAIRHREIARLLMEAGADPRRENSDGETPLDLWPELAEVVKEVEAEKRAKRANIDPPQSPASQGQPPRPSSGPSAAEGEGE